MPSDAKINARAPRRFDSARGAPPVTLVPHSTAAAFWTRSARTDFAQAGRRGADTEMTACRAGARQNAGGHHVDPIRVMVVDDSVVVRKIVTDVLSSDPGIDVV